MRALLYDVHGNLPALEAVLADADGAGADSFLLGGDYLLFGAWPAETLDRLRSLPAEWIRGNGERWTAAPESAPDSELIQGAIAVSRGAVGANAVGELGGLPETASDEGVLYCHASPSSDVVSFFPEPASEEAELLEGVEVERLVFGHTHLQFRRRSAVGVELVNPGSVGMPFDDDPRPGYALIDDSGELELRRVPYDHVAAASEARERLPDWGETIARRIERARMDA